MGWITGDANGADNSLELLGWAQYLDTEYTDAVPQTIAQGNNVILSNNAGSVIDEYLPSGVVTMYDSVTNKILPVLAGDTYLLRIDFMAYTSSQSGYGEMTVDIGGATGVILEIPVTFPKGAGIGNIRSYTSTTLIFSLGDFVANGGIIRYESISGATFIHNTKFIISKVTTAP